MVVDVLTNYACSTGMARRILPLAVVLLLLLPVTEAVAWSNGVNGPNSFGTHDWIVREGVRLAGRQGRWVCLPRAMKATDDPDIRNGIDHASGTWWHVWDEWGATYGGAPEAVRVWYSRTKRLRARHQPCKASHALGIMAHMLGDVAQPMHTDGRLAIEDSVHGSYEHAVDTRCRPAHCIYRANNDGPDRAAPYGRALALARDAHPFYARLIKSYRLHGYNPTVGRITRRQLNRAANALADLVRSL